MSKLYLIFGIVVINFSNWNLKKIKKLNYLLINQIILKL